MKTIKIIDLLNKIANGKKYPKIKFNNNVYKYHDEKHGYCRHYYDNTYICLNTDYCLLDILNDEAEILEEEKKIPEKIDLTGYWDKNSLRTEEWCFSEELIGVKVNEIIDYLESKEKGE